MSRTTLKTKVLIVIDCQNDFIDGSLKNPEAARAIPSIIGKILGFYGDYILVTKDTHDVDYLKTKEGLNLPIEHCIKETYGWMLNQGVVHALNARMSKNDIKVLFYEKHTFGSEDILEFLRALDDREKNLEIQCVGFCTDICVVSNALMLKNLLSDDCNIIVDASCCAGTTPEKHKSSIEVMKSCQIKIIND